MTHLPFAAQLIAAALICLSGIMALLSAYGQIRFTTFKTRIHALGLVNSLGLLLLILGCSIVSYFGEARGFLHELIIVAFIYLTSPISSMLLIRSYIMRIERMTS